MSSTWRDKARASHSHDHNHGFDRRIQAVPPFVGNLQRGKITTIKESPRKSFFFLFNPSVIQTSYQVSTIDYTNPDAMNGATMDLGDGLMSISFDIMLDRTYECWSNRASSGILEDIRALEVLFGLAEEDAEEIERGSTTEGVVTHGILAKKPVRFRFGTRRAYDFDGFVQSLSVNFTNFTYRMVPQRGTVSFQATSIGTHQSVGAGSPTSSSATGAPTIGGGLPGSAN